MSLALNDRPPANKTQIHTKDPKHSPGRTLLDGRGKNQSKTTVRKELRSTDKNGGPRKKF